MTSATHTARDSRIGRRQTLIGTAALTVSAVAAPAILAQQAAPKVFRDLTQDELDRAYDQRVWAANAAEVVKRYTTTSEDVRRRYRRLPAQSYGPTAEEVLDIFPAARARAPVHIFVHGGAWRSVTKDDSSFPAPAFIDAGAHYVALNFANIPQVRLPDMAAQVRRAIAWVYRNAASFDGDPDRLYLSGHSSGAHLAAVALVTDWVATHGAPPNIVKGALLISGMYDLEAPMLSARSSYVKISKDEEHALSPQRHLDRLNCPVIVAHGDGESPEFKRQARDFDAALKRRNLPSTLIDGKGFNHFELVETLGQTGGLLGRAALKQMGLA